MAATRVISFDLDDTLWPVAPVIAAAESALHDWLNDRYPRAMHGHNVNTLRALRAKIAAQFPEQSHDLTFLRRRALAAQFRSAGYAESACDEALEIFLTARNRVEFFDDVRPTLERLRSRYKLFALSNGNADIERCGLGALFDGHVTAIAAGAAKPDARIFAVLRERAGVPAEEILHVGDDPITDIVGARQAGMQTAWLNRDARSWPVTLAPPERTIVTLAEIL
jgi:FMN hydrolase / 5-amino-6-(5-phospho-D-ribitylamino)uracil phosphatase